jgi:hypothetical protein
MATFCPLKTPARGFWISFREALNNFKVISDHLVFEDSHGICP